MSEILVGGLFFHANLIFSKVDEIITHNKVTTNQSTGERERQVLNLIEDKDSSEEEIMIVLEE